MTGMRMTRLFTGILALGMMSAGLALAQTGEQGQPSGPGSGAYKPQFPGDPARSASENQALAYMRVVLRAQRAYEKKHGKYAGSLAQLVGSGSFTKRLASSTDRGDYTASFRPHKEKGSDKEGFILTMTPKHMDSEHRSFYAEEDGIIRGDDEKAAGPDSPKVK